MYQSIGDEEASLFRQRHNDFLVADLNQFQATNKNLEKIISELQKIDHDSFPKAVVYSIGRLSEELNRKLTEVAAAAKAKQLLPAPSLPDIKVAPPAVNLAPKITVQSPDLSGIEKLLKNAPVPQVHVEAPNVSVNSPDLTGIERVLKKEFPKIVKQFTDSIPEVPETDLTSIEKALDELGTIMAQVRDRKIPVPQPPTTLKVTNPDGSAIGSSTPGALVWGLITIPTVGARVQLPNNPTQAFVLQAPSTNTLSIYVGGNTVSSTSYGAELQPGQSVGVSVGNTNNIFVDTATNGNKISVIGS